MLAPSILIWIDELGLRNKFAFDHPDCVARRKKISNIENDIIKRNQEIKANPGNLPYQHTPGMKPRDSVEGHIQLVKDLEETLKKHKKWLSDNCDDSPPSSPGTCTTPTPVPSPNKDKVQDNLETAGTIVGGAATLYVGYKVVRAIILSAVATPIAGFGSLMAP